MSTKEWGVGYDEGYIKGWNDAMDEKPAEASEPVAYIEHHKAGDNLVWDNPGANSSPLYTTPQPAQQEPVAFYRCNGCGHAYEQVHPTSCDCMEGSSFEQVNYYTSPPAQRTWVGLTDAQSTVIWANSKSVDEAIRATEERLKENNK